MPENRPFAHDSNICIWSKQEIGIHHFSNKLYQCGLNPDTWVAWGSWMAFVRPTDTVVMLYSSMQNAEVIKYTYILHRCIVLTTTKDNSHITTVQVDR